MNRLLTVILCGLVIAGLFVVLPVPGTDGVPSRDLPDLRPVVNIPENGGRYQKEMGLRVNVTLFNDGADMGSTTGNLSLVITNLETGENVNTNFFPIQFSGIASGENKTFEFTNWTGAFAGRFVANVTAQYQNDGVPGNNHVEHTFSMWSDYYPGRPELISKQVSPIRGNTSTLFTFKTEFKYNKIPKWVKIEVDDDLFDMDEDDPDDDIPNDGKMYRYESFLPIGNHRYRFISNVTGLADIITPFSNSPWVNISLKNVNVTPTKGYVTTPFHFSVDYGSEKNLAPSPIYLDIGPRTFNLTRSSPNPDYQGARVEFSAIIRGIDLLPSPLDYYIRCTTDGESYSIGPYEFEGPNMTQVNLTGTVSELDGTPLPGVVVGIDPGETTRTDPMGDYRLTTHVGPRFQVTYSKDGYLPRSYELNILEDRNLNIELEKVPVGGSISGLIRSSISGEIASLSGATVNISIAGYSNETITSSDGYYLMEGIPAGSFYILRVSEFRHDTTELTISIRDGELTVRNITLTERDMGVSIEPGGSGEAIAVDQEFIITFPSLPDINTVKVTLENSTSPQIVSFWTIPNTTKVQVESVLPLIFNSQYTLSVGSGILDDSSKELLVWKNLSWVFVTELQPFTDPIPDPPKDSLDIPLDKVITISFGIGLNQSTFTTSLTNRDMDLGDVQLTVKFQDTINWSDSGRTDTIISIVPENLTYSTRYSLEVSELLKDIHGRNLLEEPLMIEFTTIREPDNDGDGVADSLDIFPDDPAASIDTDGDGYPDSWNPGKIEADSTTGLKLDAFPQDPDEWNDLDGDGTGDNADTDDDGDQMPDDWEIANGLDPNEPMDAFLDEDGDGFSNLEEYLEGTDPQDKNDHPDEGGFNTNLIIIGIAIGLVVVIVVVAILYMLGVIGSKKGEPIGEE